MYDFYTLSDHAVITGYGWWWVDALTECHHLILHGGIFWNCITLSFWLIMITSTSRLYIVFYFCQYWLQAIGEVHVLSRIWVQASNLNITSSVIYIPKASVQYKYIGLMNKGLKKEYMYFNACTSVQLLMYFAPFLVDLSNRKLSKMYLNE